MRMLFLRTYYPHCIVMLLCVGVSLQCVVFCSTATGMLDSIVVRNTEGGQACMEFLRKFDVGRATFIVLDQVYFLMSVILTNTCS